jgi:hypothetical protein
LPDIWPEEGSVPRRKLSGLVREAAAKTSLSQGQMDIMIVGDSTTTPTGGGGRFFIHYLNLLLAEFFGNLPATPWFCTVGSENQSCMVRRNAPISAGLTGTGNIVQSNGTTNQIPPWVTGQIASTLRYSLDAPGQGGDNLGGESFSLPNSILQQHMENYGGGPMGVPSGIFPDDGRYMEVMILKQPLGDTSLRLWREAVSYSDDTTDVTGVTLASADFPIDCSGTDIPGSPNWQRNLILGPFPKSAVSNHAYTLDTLGNTHMGKYSVIALRRYLNANPVGMSAYCISAGGYGTWSWFGSPGDSSAYFNGQCQPFIKTLNPRIIIFMMGLNDAYDGRTPDKYMTDTWNPSGMHTGVGGRDIYGLAGEILRACPNAFPIFVGVSYRANQQETGYATNDGYAKQYAGVLQTIAAATGGVFINLRSMQNRLGWNASCEDNTANWIRRGAWDPAYTTSPLYIPYKVPDIVLWTDGIYYKCISQHASDAGKTPANGTYWASMMYNAGTAYSVGDICQSPLNPFGMSYLWQCQVASTGHAPPSDVGVPGGVTRYWRSWGVHTIDGTHWTPYGSMLNAKLIARAIIGGNNLRPKTKLITSGV